jgi:hypothetical protein
MAREYEGNPCGGWQGVRTYRGATRRTWLPPKISPTFVTSEENAGARQPATPAWEGYDEQQRVAVSDQDDNTPNILEEYPSTQHPEEE